jgi:hypothetical protein
MTKTRKFGNEIQVGDIVTVGYTSHRIVEIAPYTHPSIGETCGIAKAADGWAITLTDTVALEVA